MFQFHEFFQVDMLIKIGFDKSWHEFSSLDLKNYPIKLL